MYGAHATEESVITSTGRKEEKGKGEYRRREGKKKK